jgi:hypothetical protein
VSTWRDTSVIPVPTSISPAARAGLRAMLDLDLDLGDTAPPEDHAGWEQLVAFTDEMLLAILPTPADGTTVEPITVGGIPAYDVRPSGSTEPCASTASGPTSTSGRPRPTPGSAP